MAERSSRFKEAPGNRPPGLALLELPGFRAQMPAFGFTTQTAADGRLLAEFRAPNDAKAALTAQITERRSSIVGSRLGLLENFSALDAISNNPVRWSAAQNGIVWFREKYLQLHPTDHIRAEDLHKLATLGMYAVVYAMYHANGYGENNALPTVLADMFKIFQGIHRVGIDMEGLRGSDVLKADEVYDHAEKEHLLVTFDRQACPAGPNMIKLVAGLILHGNSVDRTGKIDPALSELHTIFPDLDDMRHVEQLASSGAEYSDAIDLLYDDLDAVPGTSNSSSLSTDGKIALRGKLDIVFLRHAMRMTEIQRDVNIILGRDETNAPIITVDAMRKNSGQEWNTIYS